MSAVAGLTLSHAAARLGDWVWSLDTDIARFSERGAEIFELTSADRSITWAALRERIHPDDRERTRLAVQKSVEANQDYITEYRFLGKYRVKWISASGRLVTSDESKRVGMQGSVQDRTRDHVLAELDRAVAHILDPAELMLIAARVLGENLNVNRCAYATVEDDQDTFQLEGNYTKDVHSIVGRYTFRQFGSECLRLMRSGQPYVVADALNDARIDAPDVAAYQATGIRAVICVPVMKSGRFVIAMAVHCVQPREWDTDEVELVLAAANRCWESIERAGIERERTALLERDRLAHRTKDEFLAVLGHELRNPLAPIVTSLELMRLQGGEHYAQERAIIERQVAHLGRLVDDLLDVARIAQGKVRLSRQQENVAELIGVAAQGVETMISAQGHTLRILVPDEALLVDADATRVTQIMTNLLANAAKYTPQGGLITVSAEADAGFVTIRVADNGIGMAPEMLQQVFDMFVQGRQGLERSQGGLGLGLAIARNLVELHGGSISAASAGKDLGSEFTVRLPRAGAGTHNAGAEAASSVPVKVPASQAHKRVLVVDDNEDAAAMIASALRRPGRDVRVAHDGEAALAMAREFEPDVAIVDIGLPVMNGFEVAEGLTRSGGKVPKLIALTGYGQAQDRERALASGFEVHLVKPVTIDTLEKCLSQI